MRNGKESDMKEMVKSVAVEAKERKLKSFWLFLVLILFVPVMARAVMLDREGIKVESLITDTSVEFVGHTFTRGSSTRTYLFEFHGTYKEFWDGKLGKTFPVNTKEKVTWNRKSHLLSVHAEEKGFYFDTVYQCDMDPLLSVDAPQCTQTSHKTNWKGDWSVAWGDSRTEIEQLRDGIPTGRRFALTLEALAKSMKVEVSSSKVKSPPGNVLLTVHTDPTVLPPKGWPVTFWIEKKYGGVRFNDLYGKEVDNHHHATLLRGSTFYLLRNLQAGQYTFWSIMNTTLTGNPIASKNQVIFKVVNDLYTPVILVPKEGAKLGKKSKITVRVAGESSNSDIEDARLEVQYSKLAKQYPYKKLRVIKSGKAPFWPGGVWECSCPIGNKLGVPLEGDFRIRARMYYQDKPMGDWSEWRHFHVGKEVVAIIERPFKIISPAEGQTYSNEIPVNISLPGFVGENPRLTLTWIWTPATKKASNGLDIHGFPHELMKKTVSVASGKMALLTYHGSMKVKSLYDKVKKVMGGSAGGGSFSLRADLKFSDLPLRSRYVTFYAGMLGTPVKKDEEKKKDLSYHMNIMPQFISMNFFYRPGEDIRVRLRNAPRNRVKFEVRYRSPKGKSFALLPRIPHHFTTVGDTTVLHLKFKEPGRYQIRFKYGDRARWCPWRGFTVVGTSLKAANEKKNPSRIQPKTHLSPPKIAVPIKRQTFVRTERTVKVNTKIRHATGYKVAMNEKKNLSRIRPKIHLSPPKIVAPWEHQTFILTGGMVKVNTKIQHATGYKVAMEVQIGNHGRFSAFHPQIIRHSGKTETNMEMSLTKTGTYRIRVKLVGVSNAAWSPWRSFKVDKLAKAPIRKTAPKPSSLKKIRMNPTGI